MGFWSLFLNQICLIIIISARNAKHLVVNDKILEATCNKGINDKCVWINLTEGDQNLSHGLNKHMFRKMAICKIDSCYGLYFFYIN